MDDLMFFWIIFLLILIRFYFAIYANIKYFKYGPEEDSLTYYFWAQFYEKNKSGDVDNRSIISKSPNTYTFWYLLLSIKIFGNRTLFKYSWLPNFFIHLFVSILILFFLRNENFSNILMIKFFIIYVLQINSISYHKKNIHYLSFSPRFLAMIFCSLYWVIYFFEGSNYIYLIFLFLLSYLCLSTSLFSRQTFVITNLVYFILSFDLHLIIYLFAGFILFYLFNKNEFGNQIKNHLSHLKAYQKRNLIQNNKFKLLKWSNIKKYFYLQVVIDGKNLIFLTFLTLSISSSLKIQLFIISLLLIFFLISLRIFSFLGESYRYSEYSMFFLFPYLICNAKNSFFFFIITYLFLYRFFIISPKPKKYFKYFIEIAENHFAELKNAIWYSINFRMSQIPLCIGYGEKGFTFNFSSLNIENEKEYFAQYPYLVWNEDILVQNDVSHILVYKPLLSEAIRISNFDVSQLFKLCENDYFIIYRTKKFENKN